MKNKAYILNFLLAIFGLSIVLSAISCSQISIEEKSVKMSDDERKIRQVHADYVKGWKNMDEHQVMDLLESEAQIQPNKFNPVIGKENIRDFWFPKDALKPLSMNLQLILYPLAFLIPLL